MVAGPGADVMVCPNCQTRNQPGAKFCRGCGSALPAAARVPAVRTGPAPALSPRKNRRRILIVTGAAVVVLVAVGVLYAVQTYGFSPTDPVEELFTAMSHRDAAAVAKVVNTDDSPFITDSALHHGYTPPSDWHVGKPVYGEPDQDDTTRRPNRNVAYVPVTYKLGSDKTGSTIRLERNNTGWFRGWSIVDGATAMLAAFSPYVKHVKVGSETLDVDTTAAGGDDGLGPDSGPTVLPGRYTVSLPASEPLFTMKPYTLDMTGAYQTGQSHAQVTVLKLPVSVKPSVITAVQQQVRDKIDKCAKSTAFAPDGCPFEDENFYYPEPKVSWTINSYPTITLKPDHDPSADQAVVEVDTTKSGSATARYENYGKKAADSVDISPSGWVTVVHGKPTWRTCVPSDIVTGC
jgi:zinc ribbon protein